MHAPYRFVERLDREFDNRIRIRWSHKRQQWHLEYKVARAILPNFYIGTEDDSAIRARDGYAFLMEITRGDKAPCPRCGYELQVPINETKEVVCTYCKISGKDGRYKLAYYDLDGEKLMEHLRELDPLRTYRDGRAKRADAANKAVMDAKEKDFKNAIEAITRDNFRQLAGIPLVGYTGKGK